MTVDSPSTARTAASSSPRSSWADRLRRALAGSLLVIVVVYAPMAIEYTARFYSADAPRLWDHTLQGLAGGEFEGGPASVTAVQNEAYRQERIWMSIHTTMGGTALFLGIW